MPVNGCGGDVDEGVGFSEVDERPTYRPESPLASHSTRMWHVQKDYTRTGCQNDAGISDGSVPQCHNLCPTCRQPRCTTCQCRGVDCPACHPSRAIRKPSRSHCYPTRHTTTQSHTRCTKFHSSRNTGPRSKGRRSLLVRLYPREGRFCSWRPGFVFIM